MFRMIEGQREAFNVNRMNVHQDANLFPSYDRGVEGEPEVRNNKIRQMQDAMAGGWSASDDLFSKHNS